MNMNNESVGSVNDEIKEVLRRHPGNLGTFHKLREDGMSPKQMQKEHGNQTYSYIAYLKVILGEESNSGSRLLEQSARAIRGLLNKYEFSPAAKRVLKSRE